MWSRAVVGLFIGSLVALGGVAQAMPVGDLGSGPGAPVCATTGTQAGGTSTCSCTISVSSGVVQAQSAVSSSSTSGRSSQTVSCSASSTTGAAPATAATGGQVAAPPALDLPFVTFQGGKVVIDWKAIESWRP